VRSNRADPGRASPQGPPHAPNIADGAGLVDARVHQTGARGPATDITDGTRLVDPGVDHPDAWSATTDVPDRTRLIDPGIPNTATWGTHAGDAADRTGLIDAGIDRVGHAGHRRGQGCHRRPHRPPQQQAAPKAPAVRLHRLFPRSSVELFNRST
jgi:hypothetical protein